MSYDGLVTTAITAELNKKLINGRIDRIYQPSSDEIILHIRSGGEKHMLYMSSNTEHPGVYLTEEKDSNPQNPPAFCMLLRKHLQSSRIRAIRQVDSERIIEIDTDSVNELGFNVNHRLIIEIMGKHSNVLLTDLSTGRILDSIKRVSIDINRYRQSLPGVVYVPPPSHDKIPYFKLTKDEFFSAVSQRECNRELEKELLRKIQGISPLVASELVFRARFEEEPIVSIYNLICEFAETAASGSCQPKIYMNDKGSPADFHVIDMTILEPTYNIRTCATVSEACQSYYEGRTASNRIRQKASDMRRIISNNLDRLMLKRQRLSEDLLAAENSDRYRLYGELLTASLHTVAEGRESAEVNNYYDGTVLTIPLNPRFTAAQNAQRYFKKYAKSKTAVKEKKLQLDETDDKIDYLESVVTFIDNARTTDDLDDIRTELAAGGFLKKQSKGGLKLKNRIKPYEYATSSGFKVLIGRNNLENDQLTFKLADSNDIWLHTKDIHGSHVLLRTKGGEPSHEDIREAALLAAWHSKAKYSSSVPVDYVRAKHVKKPAGSRPGYVTFTKNKTIYVDPEDPDADKNAGKS